MSAPSPELPSLDRLRGRAKVLLRDHRAGEASARARVAAHHPRPGEPLKLAGAQLVIAREHGFASWPRLRAYLDRLAAHGPALEHAYHEDLDYYAGRAKGLLASAVDGTPTAAARGLPRGQTPAEGQRGQTPSASARVSVARAHGFSSWEALRRHVGGLRETGEPFARAYRAVEDRDLGALRGLLDGFPALARLQGTNGNDLLGMASATGDLRLTALLLARGADVDHANVHGWTALHQAGYSNRAELAEQLLAAGARTDRSGRGDGGTPLVAALFWGNRKVAAVLAARDRAPGNLRVAAGLGDVEAIAELVGSDAAGAHRGFYRPHGGFPAWQPSEDPQEVLDEALSWAARSARPRAVTALVRHGARLEADVYRGTALAWAAARGRVRTIARLIELGADPSGRTSFGGPQHGEHCTPLHLAAQNGGLDVIRALLAAGAETTARDGLFDSTPLGWAEECEQAAAAALLREG